MNILISGISRGLGLTTAKLALKNGWNVFGFSRTMTYELNQLVAKYPSNLNWIQFDLQEINKISKNIFIDWIGKRTPIHGLVNNASLCYNELGSNFEMDFLEKSF